MAPVAAAAPAPAPAASPFAAAATSAARACRSNLSFSAEPLDPAALAAIAEAAAAPDCGADDASAFDADAAAPPAGLRQKSRAGAAGIAYARRLSAALDTAASAQLEGCGLGVSGPQGKAVPFTVIRDPAAWTAKTWAGGVGDIIYELSPSDADAIAAATAAYMATGAPLAALRRPEQFPLPEATAARLAAVKAELLRGRGVAVLRGMPLGDLASEREALAAYLGVCAHIGRPGPQWKCGRVLTHVTSRGATVDANLAASKHGPEAFNRSDAFEMHHDSCADVLSLLCIRQAASGGESAFSSALAVYNEMLRRGRLDCVAVLAGAGFYRDKTRFQAELLPGASPLWEMPVFSWHNGYLTSSYNANLNKQCEERYPELAGRLSPLQREAMDLFNEIANADDMKLRIRLQAGDVAMINNINVMHSRSTFVDDPEAPRHLVRAWLLCTDSPHALPKHLDFPRSHSMAPDAGDALAAAGGPDGLMMRLPPSALYVPLSTGERA